MKTNKSLGYKFNIKNENIDYDYSFSDEKLGSGSFGNVYKGINKINNKKVAVKCCDINDEGIPKIFEASIMATINHPHINKAENIIASDNKLYIIQPLAKTDMNKYSRIHNLNINQIRDFSWKICQAVYCLHDQNIIHADIKPSNILLFDNNNVKLTDFSLSLKYKKDKFYNHSVCTSMYRPLECFLGETWDKSLDIWSLGCTLYQIAYGKHLIPYQGELIKHLYDIDRKEMMKIKCINCLLDFNKKNPLNIKNKLPQITKTNFLPCNYLFNNSKEFKSFNNLLFLMLQVDKNQRINIKNVLNHEFFKNMKKVSYNVYQHKKSDVSIKKIFNKNLSYYDFIKENYIRKLIKNLFEHSYKYLHRKYSSKEILAGCIWIGTKIFNNDPFLFYIPKDKVLKVEKDISNFLSFRLHQF